MTTKTTLQTVEAHARQLISALGLWPGVYSYAVERGILNPAEFSVTIGIRSSEFVILAARDAFLVERRVQNETVILVAVGEYAGATWRVSTGFHAERAPDLHGLVFVQPLCKVCGKRHTPCPANGGARE